MILVILYKSIGKRRDAREGDGSDSWTQTGTVSSKEATARKNFRKPKTTEVVVEVLEIEQKQYIIDMIYCHVQGNTWNFSSALNPSRLAPVEHTHAQGHTLIETDAVHWSGGQPITAPGEHGGTVPCSRAPRPWQGGGLPPLQLSVHQSLSGESGNVTANLPIIRQPTVTTEPRPPIYGRHSQQWKIEQSNFVSTPSGNKSIDRV